MTTIQINLPDQLAQEAQRAGLLTPAAMERILRECLKLHKTDELFAAMEKMSSVDDKVMSPEDVSKELHAMRAERRGSK